MTPIEPDLVTIIEAHGGNRKKRLVLYAILALVVIGGGWYWQNRNSNAQATGPQFMTAPIERGDISLVVIATGNLQPTNQVTIGSELSGTVQEVFVDINDRLTKGQPLAKLDTAKLTQQTESSRANLESARAKVSLAKATFKESTAALARAEELRRISDGKVPSKADLDTAVAMADRAEADVAASEAAVAVASAQLRANESDLGKAVIKSPIDGVVLTRSVEPGQTVAASFTAPQLFVIAEDLKKMILKVAVAEADIGRLNAGQKATFKVDAWPDRYYTANVSTVSYGSAVTDNVVTYLTELDVTNDDLSLRPGMTASAEIEVAEASGVLLVPSAALRFRPADPSAISGAGGPPKKTFVQTLMPGTSRGSGRRRPGADGGKPTGRTQRESSRIYVLKTGAPEPIPVKTGLSDGRRTEISGEGLTEGMPIITRATPTVP